MTANVQRLTILAQDPAVKRGGALVLEQIEVPAESLKTGPTGYRVKVVDFDATTNSLYAPFPYAFDAQGLVIDPFALPARKMSVKQRKEFDQKLLGNPNFHAQHTYAVVMRILARFEFALGRRVAWGFNGHQLHVAPHAFCEANAFYSEADRALLFGYFEGKRKGEMVFTCLSHDIVAHETTHALLDGLRDRFTELSGPDQAAFHEGFSDVVALLSMFALKSIVELAFVDGPEQISLVNGIRCVSAARVTPQAIADSILFGLGKEFGQHLAGARTNALRQSLRLKPRRDYLKSSGFQEAHDRSEVFSAALLRAFLDIWSARIAQLGTFGRGKYNLDMVIQEGAKAADHLLTIAIRALDYCPPVDIEFGDYVAALLTVDREVAPDDSRYGYRKVLRKTFASYGIHAPAATTDGESCWLAFDRNDEVTYAKSHFESMLRDKEEVFRFVWENLDALRLDDRGYIEVTSVRASVRQGPDGFMLRETICEYIQIAQLFAAEAKSALGIDRPEGMSTQQRFTAFGGGVLVFDQYGRVKYHVARCLNDAHRQSRRLEYLWQNGMLEEPPDGRDQFASAHRMRAAHN